MKTNYSVASWVIVLAALAPVAAWAQLAVTDDFTKGSANTSWKAFNGACLTAGDGSGTVPACVGLLYYTEPLVGGVSGSLPDPSGQGALRFTNGRRGGYHQNGAIVLDPAKAFPTNKGVQVTFTTVTYRGDSGGGGRDGADGISFFLMDGSVAPDLGAFGGSLGYTCSNTNNDPTLRADGTERGYDGLVGAYLGLGIDEYGNFLNGSNPLTGYNGDNTASGYGYVPGRIGLRGAGNVAWRWLNQNYPSQYPASLTTAQRASAVQRTCRTGVLWDYSGNGNGNGNGNNPVISAVQPPANQPLDYPAIPNAFSILSGVQIANESAVTRGDGTPITYKLKITQGGLLSLSYSINSGVYLPVISGQDITAANGPLPASFLFGFAGSTGGSTNIHEIMCFRAVPNNQSASSAGVNEEQTAKVQAGAQVYFAYFNPDTWAGSLTAQNITLDAQGNVTGISSPIWDASCVLTGAAQGPTCPSTGAPSAVAQPPISRTILTWDGAQGVPFEWANLTPAQRAALDVTDGFQTTNRLDFLRGDRTNEEPVTGPTGSQIYRDRTSVLGDIIDSSPDWVGPPSSPYSAVFKDKINAGGGYPENAGQSYATFKSIAQTRLNVVYSGANDGLLHGFRTGSYNASNKYVNAQNDGLEVLAYMPGAVLGGVNNIRGYNIPPNNSNTVDPTLDFSDPQYGHNYFVDASPGDGELFYGGKWHTWLVGGLGAGGAAIYALDVTDPSAGSFNEANAKNLVMGEWTSNTISCVNVGGCGANLGNTYGVPQVRRFHNGKWGAVFGNGLNTANGSAGIFVMVVDPASGAATFYYFGAGGNVNGNGIAYTTPVDLDNDNIIDYVYAGDVKGNIWRFDLTSSNPAAWRASASPLFTTPGGQPITTKLVAALTPANSGPPRVMIDFGTGSATPFSNIAPQTYASGGQSLYGVWDWNMGGLSGWNSKGSTQYASLTAPQAFAVSDLVVQTITTTGTTRSITNNPVCWQGSTDCASGNSQFGWTVALPGSGEQIVFSPTLDVGLFIVNTLIPATNMPFTCASQLASGFTMAISPTSGGSFTNSVFADPTTGSFLTKNISGMEWSGTGSGSVVTGGGTGALGSNVYFITQTVSGTPLPPQQINPPGGKKGGRLTWIERR
jgi:type IV pilus assembly protein PilY1